MEAPQEDDELLGDDEDPLAALLSRGGGGGAAARGGRRRGACGPDGLRLPPCGAVSASSLSRALCALGAAAGGLAFGAAALGGAAARGGSSAARRQPGRSGAQALLGLAEDSVHGGPDCHTALDGEYCYSAVLWGMQQGLTEKPKDYPGLSLKSGFRDFQRVLHERNVGDCPEPCADEGAQRPPVSRAAAEQCAFDYNGGPEARCFCQLAGNAACSASDCSCPEGCDVAWNHSATVTFRNKNEASGCEATTGLLTIPRSYFRDVEFLQTWCPQRMHDLLVEMLREGLGAYQEHVDAEATVWQCIHAAPVVSTAWLHLHTFCAAGSLDGLPAGNGVAWCAQMTKADQADLLAAEIAKWTADQYGRPPNRRPTSCAELGCGKPGPAGQCSCHERCRQSDDCCDDYDKECAL